MKILINTYPTIFQNKGGIQKRVLEHCEMLNEEFIESVIFNPNINIKEFDILTTFKPLYSNFDVFETAKKYNLKTVTHSITEIPNNLFVFLILKIISFIPFTLSNLQRRIIKKSDIVIALSESEKKLLIKKYNIKPYKIKVVPNAINVEKFTKIEDSNCFKEKYNIKEKYVLCVGRIEKNKNQLLVAKSLKNLNIRLIIIGEKTDKKYAAEIEKFPFVTIIENIDYSSEFLASAYKNAELFILPSKKEISPNTIIEAALTGVPVICTKNTLTIYEYFRDSILYFDPNSSKDLTKKINKFLENKNIYKNKAIKVAIDFFSKEIIIKKHMDIYKKLQFDEN